MSEREWKRLDGVAGAAGVAKQRGGGAFGAIGAADAAIAGTGCRIGAQRGAARQHGPRPGQSGGGAGTGTSASVARSASPRGRSLAIRPTTGFKLEYFFQPAYKLRPGFPSRGGAVQSAT
jgi:hypothetical protein